ncbi:uncharacterized protein [Clytia hemisphaerica]|uniref:uncharacterized protein n=1 Tax=Clytia hemisphaerica TaxID=252671 RepID=UPI0034D3C79B
MREAISAEEKLAVTLCFLATGESFSSLQYQFRMHRSTISLFIVPVCKAIYKHLAPHYMKTPSTKEEWQQTIIGNKERWQFPNCFAAADGKHIAIKCPPDSGSEFFNYKGFYSVVLLAFVDFDYKFLIAEVGCQGRISDGGVYRSSDFFKDLKNECLGLPPPQPLPQEENDFWFEENPEDLPMVFVADEAFPLGEHCLKPYARRGMNLS